MITPRQISWIAALLEGEGSFHWNRGRCPVIEIAMTDLDVIERAWRLLAGPGKIITRAWRPLSTKPIYRFHLYSDHAAAWMMTIYTEMGQRRREQIRNCLAGWRTTQPHPRRRLTCVNGHPLERLSGDRRGCLICGAAWLRNYRTVNREKIRTYGRNARRVWRAANPELARESVRRWRAKRKLAIAMLEAV